MYPASMNGVIAIRSSVSCSSSQTIAFAIPILDVLLVVTDWPFPKVITYGIEDSSTTHDRDSAVEARSIDSSAPVSSLASLLLNTGRSDQDDRCRFFASWTAARSTILKFLNAVLAADS